MSSRVEQIGTERPFLKLDGERSFAYGLHADSDDSAALPEGLNRPAQAKKTYVPEYDTLDVQTEIAALAKIRRGLADLEDESENLDLDVRAGSLLVELGGDPSVVWKPHDDARFRDRPKDEADVEAEAFLAELMGAEPPPSLQLDSGGFAGKAIGWQAELQLSQYRMRQFMEDEGIDPTLAAGTRAFTGSIINPASHQWAMPASDATSLSV